MAKDIRGSDLQVLLKLWHVLNRGRFFVPAKNQKGLQSLQLASLSKLEELQR